MINHLEKKKKENRAKQNENKKKIKPNKSNELNWVVRAFANNLKL